MNTYEITALFDTWRIDHWVIKAKNKKSAKKKFEDMYKKKSQKCLTGIKVRRVA